MHRRQRMGGRVLAATVVAFLGLLPGLATAEGRLFGTVTLWEVQEYLRLKAGSHSDNLMFRLANATLVGDATGNLCGPVKMDPCAMDARARSTVSLDTGTGPLSGAFNILLDPDPVSPLLSDLVLGATGILNGTLDLRLATLFIRSKFSTGGPVAPAQGHWRSRDLDVRGTFVGGFLIPVPSAPFAAALGVPDCGRSFAYVNLSFAPGHAPQPVLPPDVAPVFACLGDADFSLGSPVTKFVGSLFAR